MYLFREEKHFGTAFYFCLFINVTCVDITHGNVPKYDMNRINFKHSEDFWKISVNVSILKIKIGVKCM